MLSCGVARAAELLTDRQVVGVLLFECMQYSPDAMHGRPSGCTRLHTAWLTGRSALLLVFLFTSLFAWPIQVFVHLCIYLSIYLSYLTKFLFIFLSIYLSIFLSSQLIFLSMRLPVYVSISLSFLSVSLTPQPWVCLLTSVYLYISFHDFQLAIIQVSSCRSISEIPTVYLFICLSFWVGIYFIAVGKAAGHRGGPKGV